jgi:uncharacterized protein YukE
MTKMGMDVDAVESVGRQLRQSAASVDSLVGGIDRTVSGLTGVWDGPDAQRFVQQSWPTLRKALVAAQGSVDGLGQSALNNASEQRHASGAGPTAGGSGPVLPVSPTHVADPAVTSPNGTPPPTPGDSSVAREAAFERWLPPQGSKFIIGAPTVQCVGLVNDYVQHLFPGLRFDQTVGAKPSAFQMFDGANSQYFDKIPAGQAPQPGDIVVVGPNKWSLDDGHVAVVQTVAGNEPGLVVEQSGSDQARGTFYGHLSKEEDSAIIGYLRPKIVS